MRNSWARRVVLGLILAFPLMMVAVASPSADPNPGRFFRSFSAVMPVFAVEMVLVGGMVFAVRERRRLHVEMDAARTKPTPLAAVSPAILAPSKAPARVAAFSYLKR